MYKRQLSGTRESGVVLGIHFRAELCQNLHSVLVPSPSSIHERCPAASVSAACGTIRYNVDPLGSAKDDAQIWEALEKARLADTVRGFAGDAQLDFLVSDGGSNLSAGQRQLFCIVRALIRKPKILLVDEATASVDAESDSLIQQALRAEFAHTTVITIAHRLDTIKDSDKILLVEGGKVVEFDSLAEAMPRLS